VNRNGNFPGLERKLPLLPINDPRNLESSNPAIKKAAEVKLEEDLAPQKIKALKYLASVGCGCYPGVKEAFMAALDDCTEEVRYEAVQALIEAAEDHCETCNRDCCCDEELTLKLAEMAYERDDKCCYKEPSERVREAAAEAMRACCPGRGPVSPQVVTPPPVPPTPEVPVPPRPETPVPETPATTQHRALGTPEGGMVMLFGEPALGGEELASTRPATSRRTAPAGRQAAGAAKEPQMRSAGVLARPTSLGGASASQKGISRSTAVPGRSSSVLQVAVVEEAPQPKAHSATAQPAAQPKAPAKPATQPQRHANTQAKQNEGTVAKVASGAGTVQVQLPRTANPQVGGRVKVYHRFLLNESCIGDLEIVAIGDAAVTARPVDGCNLSKLAAGDRAVLSTVGQTPVHSQAMFESAQATDHN
ncbi:MAG: hypothetical protein HY000_26225, partial [Planctomycetes bacterium]|nr:hypothetical protein [Planctomycetota bacterium]